MQFNFDTDISEEEQYWGKHFKEMLMPISEWKNLVETGFFIDYDGHGSLVSGDKVCETVFRPSDVNNIPPEATHIIWYNR